MDILASIEKALHISAGGQVKAAVKRVGVSAKAPERLEELTKKTIDRTGARPDKMVKGVKKDLAQSQKRLAKGDVQGAMRYGEHGLAEPKKQLRGVKNDAKKLERAPKNELLKAKHAAKGLVRAPGREVAVAKRAVQRYTRPPQAVTRLLKKGKGRGGGSGAAVPAAAGVAAGAVVVGGGVAVGVGGGVAVGAVAKGWKDKKAGTVHSGMMLKQGDAATSAYKKRFFSCVKGSAALAYFSDHMKIKKGTIALQSLTHIVAVSTTPLDLVLITPSRTWALRGLSEDDATEWLDLIEQESGVFAYECVEAADADDFVLPTDDDMESAAGP